MSSADFFYALGNLFEASFRIMKPLGNFTNWLFYVGTFAGVIYWSYYEIKNPQAPEKMDNDQEYIP